MRGLADVRATAVLRINALIVAISTSALFRALPDFATFLLSFSSLGVASTTLATCFSCDLEGLNTDLGQ